MTPLISPSFCTARRGRRAFTPARRLVGVSAAIADRRFESCHGGARIRTARVDLTVSPLRTPSDISATGLRALAVRPCA